MVQTKRKWRTVLMSWWLAVLIVLLVGVMYRGVECLIHVRSLRKAPRTLHVRHVSDSNVVAFQRARESAIRMPCVILVNPFLDANVGSVSRAMLNFGLHELRVVNPECNILSETATTLAVGSVEVLRNAKVYSSLEDCISDLDIVIATTARAQTVNQIRQTPAEAAAEVVMSTNGCRAGIMFGREKNGLSGEELALANRRVAIPSFEHYGVLNLAQAVNILAYECHKRKLIVEKALVTSHPLTDSSDSSDSDSESTSRAYNPEALATSGELTAFLQRLFEEMGKSERYGKINATEAEGRNITNKNMIASEHDGVSGLAKKNEMRLATIFKRVRIFISGLYLKFGTHCRYA